MVRSFGMLALALLATFAVVGTAAHARNGSEGLLAAAVAALVCWFSGSAALLLTMILRGPKLVVHALLAGMIIRLGVPLVTGTVLQNQNGPLAKAGVFGLIVVFYLVTLVVETWLSLKIVQQSQKATQA